MANICSGNHGLRQYRKRCFASGKNYDLPSVHTHRPEHHAIVPCVLLTAFRNNGEHMDYDAVLSEICKEQSRFRAVPVVTGTAGAVAGAGRYFMSATGSSPLHKDACTFLKTSFPLFYLDWQMSAAAANEPSRIAIEDSFVHFYSQFCSANIPVVFYNVNTAKIIANASRKIVHTILNNRQGSDSMIPRNHCLVTRLPGYSPRSSHLTFLQFHETNILLFQNTPDLFSPLSDVKAP
ncbi:MAG: DUF5714 domain-containing protein [Blautia massiliensis (ex Durand et al. 2017)]|uniref:DUF5714 domain-containing protein n=1 Tax=Blautia massiliensis (ex Durand et al. 2017) TaxID=1737424 RepID=UPI00399D40B0